MNAQDDSSQVAAPRARWWPFVVANVCLVLDWSAVKLSEFIRGIQASFDERHPYVFLLLSWGIRFAFLLVAILIGLLANSAEGSVQSAPSELVERCAFGLTVVLHLFWFLLLGTFITVVIGWAQTCKRWLMIEKATVMMVSDQLFIALFIALSQWVSPDPCGMIYILHVLALLTALFLQIPLLAVLHWCYSRRYSLNRPMGWRILIHCLVWGILAYILYFLFV